MDILIILLFLIMLWGVKVSPKGHDGYLDRDQTDCIKGIFAVFILYSHMRGYFTAPEGPHDHWFHSIVRSVGQAMVVMFLLYSGYGVMESIKRDRRKYKETFMRRRFLKVWWMFALAVTLFLITCPMIGRIYPLENYLLCMTGWLSVGNSNWFVFDILALYLLTYATLHIADRSGGSLNAVAIGCLVATFALMAVLTVAKGGEAYWYDTILAYPIGMLWSLHKRTLEKITGGWRWLPFFILCIVGYLICRHNGHFVTGTSIIARSLRYAMMVSQCTFFALALLLLTMKVRMTNPVLRWLGINSFAIYILQRLAMNVCAYFGLGETPMVFAGIVIPATLIISVLFTAFTNRINRLL